MKKLFQYAVLYHQYVDGKYTDSKIVVEPTYIMAKSDKEITFKITREIPVQYAEDPDHVEILIRNF